MGRGVFPIAFPRSTFGPDATLRQPGKRGHLIGINPGTLRSAYTGSLFTGSDRTAMNAAPGNARQQASAWLLESTTHGHGPAMPVIAQPPVPDVVYPFDIGDAVATRNRAIADGSPMPAIDA
jgi:hypothetical protein